MDVNTKVCKRCGEEKPIEQFNKDKSRPSGRHSWCKQCDAKYKRLWYQIHTERKERDKATHQKLRLDRKVMVLTYYGSGRLACVKCGFDDIRALSIDHIDDKGAEHRRQFGYKNGRRMGGYNIYRWLIRQGFPDGFQTLCMNCQWIKRLNIRLE